MTFIRTTKNKLPATLAWAILYLLPAPLSAAAEQREAQKLFQEFCFSCHGTGWEDAPVVGDAEAWAQRIEQGMDTLFKHTLEGFNAMPPKGGCADCSTEELRSLIEWMTE